MIRAALIAGLFLVLASPAEAHCHRIWRYPWRDPGCALHAAAAPLAARKEVMAIGRDRPQYGIASTLQTVDTSPARQTIAEPGDGPPAWAIERLKAQLNMQLRTELEK